MAGKRGRPSSDPHGLFEGMVVFLVVKGVQSRRLQIWKQKLMQMGATIGDRFSNKITHIFALNSQLLLQEFHNQNLHRFKGRILSYQWLEDSLKSGERVLEDNYSLRLELEGDVSSSKSSDDEPSPIKKMRYSHEAPESPTGSGSSVRSLSPERTSPSTLITDLSLTYSPPNLNQNITEIFGKLINIYRALGDDRRSFSYHKAIPVIEKLPFKIESGDRVKNLPGIGKSLRDHIQEIVTTGKLSKLEHFEQDEKFFHLANKIGTLQVHTYGAEVRTISLFGEVWGIGPATALKLYEKGHRTLDDLKNEDLLTHAQKLGLKYFDDINTRIPRNEVQHMEQLLQRAGEEILPGVIILCGGSYRRGKSSCGDMDVVITHPDGKSHKGFLSKYVKHLKDMKFLREDLVFSTHSEEGTDSGVDTYFGLCTYPGRELRHRIDFKVYPRDIYAFGLIAWTGNDVLNRRLRLLAESKGFRLDDTGLFPATQASGGKRGTKALASLRFNTEKEVFEFLGFPWLEPHQRNL